MLILPIILLISFYTYALSASEKSTAHAMLRTDIQYALTKRKIKHHLQPEIPVRKPLVFTNITNDVSKLHLTQTPTHKNFDIHHDTIITDEVYGAGL